MKTINEMMDEASSGKKPKKQKIPRQYLPGVIRWPLRVVLLPFVWLDLAMQRVARFFIRPPFVMEGGCKKRGACCHYILMAKTKGVLGYLFHFWATQVNGFYLREKLIHYVNGKAMRVYGCRYLKADNKCGHYKLRPMLCRKWPIVEHFGYPKMLRGCGFKAVDRKNPLRVIQ